MRERTTWDRERIARAVAANGASDRVRLRKAELAVAAAKLMLPEVDAEAVEDQAVVLMHLTDDDLIETHRRLSVGDDPADERSAFLDDVWHAFGAVESALHALHDRLLELEEQSPRR